MFFKVGDNDPVDPSDTPVLIHLTHDERKQMITNLVNMDHNCDIYMMFNKDTKEEVKLAMCKNLSLAVKLKYKPQGSK